MRIMVLADVADKALWDYLDRRLLEGVDAATCPRSTCPS